MRRRPGLRSLDSSSSALSVAAALLAVAAVPRQAKADDYDVTTPGFYYNVVPAGTGATTVQNAPLKLYRGQTYRFNVSASGHPFWLKTPPGGGLDTNAYGKGVTNNGTESKTVTFVVPSDAPAKLMYQCGNHSGMKADIKIGNTGGESCTVSNDCESGLSCTLGVCCQSSSCSSDDCNAPSCSGGTCSTTKRKDGTTCDDRDYCTTGDKCSAGRCGGAPRTCPNAACKTGYCAANACQLQPISGGTCNDSNACTDYDTCNNGTCAGSAKLCNSPGPCENDGGSCSAGSCTYPQKGVGDGCKGDPNYKDQTCDVNHVCSGGVPDLGNTFLWGRNDSGQAGGSPSSSPTTSPRRLTGTGMNNLVAIAPGYRHSLALDVAGTVYAWGANGSGEVNSGTSSSTPVTTPTPQMYYSRAIAAGFQHSIAIGPTGSVSIWGMFGNGTLNLGSSPAIAIAAGDMHGVALTADGKVWSWGYNTWGQLGVSGNPASLMTPVPASLPKPVRAITAGASYTLVLLADGTVYGWGSNQSYTLNSSNPSYNAFSPVRIGTLSDVRAIAAGGSHALALMADGTLRAWGNDSMGQLGDGRTGTFSTTPVTVSGIDRVQAISAGNSASLALRANGTVWAWGYNGDGAIGDPALSIFNTMVTTPRQVPGLSAIGAVAGPSGTVAVLQATGTVKSFGSNANGQLGTGESEAVRASSNTPRSIATPAGLPPFKAISAGPSTHRLALGADGSVWAWGTNAYGQLGNTGGDSATPVKVSGISDAIGVYAGDSDSFALRADGTLWVWGANFVGNHGDGTTSSAVYATPTQVTAVNNVIDVAARNNTLALKSDGSIYTWGWNRWWQCGTTVNQGTINSPIALALPASTYGRAVASGTYNSYVVLADGTVAAYGRNDGGELGIGTTGSQSATSKLVQGVTGAIAVSAASHYALALIGSSALYGWGVNSSSRLGTAASPVASPVSLAAAFVRGVSAGQLVTYIVVVNGAGMAMGSNTSGALGIGSDTPATTAGWTQMSIAAEVMSAAGGLNGGEILLQ